MVKTFTGTGEVLMTAQTLKHMQVGERVVLTQENVERMKSSNRSCVTPGYPSFAGEMVAGSEGEVTHIFKPGYDVTVKLDNGKSYHMKHGWFTPVA